VVHSYAGRGNYMKQARGHYRASSIQRYNNESETSATVKSAERVM
jgi:hypothetical protein